MYSDRADAPPTQRPATTPDQGGGPPRVLHFCWTNCFTLTLVDGQYVRVDGVDETWTIERFAPGAFVLHRHDAPAVWNGFSSDVTYAGVVSNDQLVNVTIGGRPVPDIRVAWGRSLDTLPGSNAERDQRGQAHVEAPAEIQDASRDDSGTADGTRASVAPPPLPNEEQPPVAQDGYLWTPGYWAWSSGGYYWIPGVWVQPPRVGVLWTPGYWAFAGAVYAFHAGYWGPHVGFYGGINYGYGYSGVGYAGGRWVGTSFAYNQAINNVNGVVVHNTYAEQPVSPVAASRASFNGGPGGIVAVPTAQEKAAAAEPHIAATQQQRQFVQRVAGQPTTMALAVAPRPPVPVAQARVTSKLAPVAHVRAMAPARVATQPAVVRATAVDAPRAQATPRQPIMPKTTHLASTATRKQER